MYDELELKLIHVPLFFSKSSNLVRSHQKIELYNIDIKFDNLRMNEQEFDDLVNGIDSWYIVTFSNGYYDGSDEEFMESVSKLCSLIEIPNFDWSIFGQYRQN